MLLVTILVGTIGWIWDWLGHRSGVTIQSAHLTIDLGAFSIVLALVLAARRTALASAWLISYALLILFVVVVLGPMVLMVLYSRSSGRQPDAGVHGIAQDDGWNSIRSASASVARWAAWPWLRAGAFEGWRLFVAGGLATLAVGVLVDVYWHQTHPMVTDTSQYMNTLTLPGHQLQLLGFVIGGIGAVIGVSSWRAEQT